MRESVKKLNEKFASISLREQVILSLMSLAVVYVLLDLLAFVPSTQKRLAAEKKLASSEKQMTDLRNQVTLYQGMIKNNPNAKVLRERKQVQDALKEIDQELEQLTLSLVAAEELPKILAKVLKDKGKLSLLTMQTLSPYEQTISAGSSDIDSGQDNVRQQEHDQLARISSGLEDSIFLYRHGVKMVVSGGYFDVLNYIQVLEEKNNHFYWESLDYRVVGYPKAVATIEVYTLSLGKGVLGG